MEFPTQYNQIDLPDDGDFVLGSRTSNENEIVAISVLGIRPKYTEISSESAQIELPAKAGDIIKRTDIEATYIRKNSSNGDISDWAEMSAVVTPTSIGLGNVENKSSATIRNEITKANITETGLTYSDIGAASASHNHDGIYAPVYNGVIPSQYVPPIAITTVKQVSNEASMIALNAQEGDVAIRTDINATFIRNAGTSGGGSDWSQMSAEQLVLSVNGKTGITVVTKSDLGLGNVENKSSATIRGEITKANITATGLAYSDVGAASVSHNHDSRYYTESEVRALILAAFPSGIIVAWSGYESDIPTGFYLCNGANRTPNLRGKFIVGAGGSYAVGNTGGADSVTLTEAQMPRHKHEGTALADGAHSHKVYLHSNVQSGSGERAADWESGSDGYCNTELEPDHTHGLSIGYKGNGQSHENRPPFYALCWIMKA